ncbi:MAG: EAL domain-containing protein, partial [Actinomycetota bacterium]|nr:EAL domain-containing protein [Actinomycetota bacterium]
MRALLAIVAIAGAIRLATALDPSVTAIVVGALVVGAAGYGLWSNGRLHSREWLVGWGLLGLGLTTSLAAAILDGRGYKGAAADAALPLVLTLAGEAVTMLALVALLRQRVPGKGVEALAASTVAAMVPAYPLFALVAVPALGWHPHRELTVIAPAFGALIVVLLAVNVLATSQRHPAAHRYLFAGFLTIFVAHAAAAGLFLAGRLASPVPLSTVLLWGCCLWGCAILHRSQRKALDPVPLHSTRPGRPVIGLMLLGALVGPAVLVADTLIDFKTNLALLEIGAATLPVLVVLYLVLQVFARSAAEYRAQHDPLTGVCNPVLFNDRLEAALADSRRARRGLAVMFLDLDRFKSINDSLGHATGNELLQAVVQRLQTRLRPKDTLGRMGGDEFIVLLPDVDGKEQGANVGERMLGAFREPFHVGGKLLPVQTSIGIAVHPEDGDDVDTLFKNADIAMYHAKSAGRNTYAVFDSTMSSRAELHFALENGLRQALDRGRLTVHYQPKVDTASAEVVGVEALARWEHPRLGFIPPTTFIPLAEETSLIASVGEWVLETACVQARSWQRRGAPRLSVAVNVSPRQFANQSLVKVVADVLSRTGLDPGLLELEVTESILVAHMEETAQSLAELRAMGIRCSIDDFGTGYSALTYLTDMPVDAIKIDPSFVSRIDTQPDAAPIVGAVIALAHSLGLQVIAEGVETVSQLRFLSEHGCDQVQGYLFSRPVPADEIDRLMADPRGLLFAQASAHPEGSEELATDRHLVLPPERLESLLAAMSASAGSKEVKQDDLLAVLAALQPEQLASLSGAPGSHVLPARIALGTLAGLASVTGLGAAGVLSPVAQQITGEILQQTFGLRLPAISALSHSEAASSFGAPLGLGASVAASIATSVSTSVTTSHEGLQPATGYRLRAFGPTSGDGLVLTGGAQGLRGEPHGSGNGAGSGLDSGTAGPGSGPAGSGSGPGSGPGS